MFRNALILLALAIVVGLPFALRPKDNLLANAQDELVIITPHNEAIRYEFARGFREWHKAHTGRTVRIDWRVPGGTTEIAHYLASEYGAPFEHYWRKTVRLKWDDEVEKSYDDAKIKLGPDPTKDTPPQAARRAFLESDVGIGIDLFFGGGSFDFSQQAAAGRLVDSGYIRNHPGLFGDGPNQIPQTLSGEPFWDKNGAWIGVVLSSFGICYNVDSLERLGIAEPPHDWSDLADPRYFGELALTDPNKSGSVTKAFEMIVQQQIARETAAAGDSPNAVARGWEKAMQLILKAGANTRYFNDSAPKIPIDVGQGDAAIGMAIDFYGRFEAESTRKLSGRERMRFFAPVGGTSYGVDPVGLLRGAPHRQLALEFIDYTLSLEAQKLWDYKLGEPGGPVKYALRRLPIRRELYSPEMNPARSDAGVFPYEEAKKFTYHLEWTAALFNPLRMIVRVMCIDPHDEARDAWAALRKAGFPREATAAFEDVSAVDYTQAGERIRGVLRANDSLAEVRLAKELSEHFRAQYRHAEELARAGR